MSTVWLLVCDAVRPLALKLLNLPRDPKAKIAINASDRDGCSDPLGISEQVFVRSGFRQFRPGNEAL